MIISEKVDQIDDYLEPNSEELNPKQELVMVEVNCPEKDLDFKLNLNFILNADRTIGHPIDVYKSDIIDKAKCNIKNNQIKLSLENSYEMMLLFETNNQSIELNEFSYKISYAKDETVKMSGKDILKITQHKKLNCSNDSMISLNFHDNHKYETSIHSIIIQCRTGKKNFIEKTEFKKIQLTTTKKTTTMKTTTGLPPYTKLFNSVVDCHRNNLKIKLIISFILYNNTILQQKDMDDNNKVTCSEVVGLSKVKFANHLGLTIDIANTDNSIELKQLNFRISDANPRNEIIKGNTLRNFVTSKLLNKLNCLEKAYLKIDLLEENNNFNDVKSIKVECQITHYDEDASIEPFQTSLITTTTTTMTSTTLAIKSKENYQSTEMIPYTLSNNSSSEHKANFLSNIHPIEIKMNQFFPIVLAVCLLILIVFSVVGFFFNRNLNDMNYRRFEI
jgi:hypothetical protein